MLQLHSSNRLESLFDRFSEVTATPLADPLTPETVVVQNQGMARWIAQQAAQRDGIAANLAFPLPASFFWEVMSAWFPGLPRDSVFDREPLIWRVMAELPRHLEAPAFAELASYLSGEPRELKRLQLCTRIADLFDQYLVYRPDWLLAWERGEEAHWQAMLWRSLAAGTAAEHRATMLARLRDAIASGLAPTRPLPERVSLFGLTALAPAYLEMLAGLSGHTTAHLFLLNPSREYWADLVSERQRARRQGLAHRSGAVDTSALLDVGNPLLASMGHAGQELLDLLLELDPADDEAFVAPAGESLLALIQSDILELRDRRTWQETDRTPVAPDDRSVQIQICHGPMREVQVLHDHLLRLFDEIDGLEPRDIVVMAPDIDLYAPYVDAVFGAVADEHQIPWSVSDRRLRSERPLTAAFASLLKLPTSRLEASEVMALLEVPAVQRCFDLDQAGLERLRTWIVESGVRWGSDAAMREGLGLPPEEANTWAFGLRRLFLGYALPPEQALFADAAPYPDVEGSGAVHLGTLQELLRRLEAWRAELAIPVPAADWPASGNRLIRDFFAIDADESGEVQMLRDALQRLSRYAEEAGLREAVSVEVVSAWLEGILDAPGSPNHFLSGRVTCCNMVPMRSIPFRVVCLLGLNDTDFPRNQRPLGFDLMAQTPRRGDRSRRRDDRYLFLEALLSARERLYLSYVGRDVRDNSRKGPSVLVSELTDYIERSFRCEGGDGPLQRITVEHPLQPFSPRYFDPTEPRLLSYRSDWLAAARADRADEPPAFVDSELAEPEPEWREVELEELIRFFANPAAFFLRQRLGVRLAEAADILADVEPFEITGLEKYGTRQTLLDLALTGKGAAGALPILRGEGRLPHGAVGQLAFEQHAAAAEIFAARVRARLPEPGEPLEVDLELGPNRLRGWLRGPRESGLVTYRFGKLRAKDRIAAWIRHLALCAAYPQQSWASLHLAEDLTLHIDHVPSARSLLEDLSDVRWQGLRAPLCFFPETSLAFAEEGGLSRNVWQQWAGAYNQFCESQDPYAAVAWRGREPLASVEFAGLAERVWRPLLDRSRLGKAAEDACAV